MEKENDQPLVYNGRENGWVLFTYPNGDVFRGYFKDNKPFEGFMTCKHSGDVYEYKVENGRHSNEYTIWYSNGDVFRGKKLVEGVNSFVGEMTYFNRYIFKGYFNNGKPFEGLMTYNRIGDVYEYKIENGRRSNEYTVKYNGGIIFKGKLDGYNNPFVGEMTYPNGNVFKGYFKDSEPFDGEMTYAKGDVCIGEWENDKPLNVSVKLKLSDTGKSYCLFRKGKNNSLRDVKYCLEDGFGNVIKAVIINYEKINKMLNKDSSKINSLDDLIESGAIEMVKSFNDLKEFSKEILKDKMSGGIENGFVGCRSSLEGLLLLSSIDTVEQLKKTRFQLYYTKEDENSLKKDYRSLKNFLKSVGIDNIKEVKEDYISLGVATIPVIHAVGVILDIKKMKELMERTGNRDLDGAVASEKVIHCFDSDRLLGYTVKVNDSLVRFNIGALHKNCDFVNLVQQELGSCWFHAVASTLTAMKYPELVEKIRNGEIKPYNVEHRALENNDKINDFQLRQMNTIRKMSEKFNIGFTQDGRGTIDVLVDNRTQEEVKKMPFPDVAREVLGIKTENKAEEIGDKKGQTDFSHSVRVIDGRSRAIEKLSKKTESSDKIIKRNLRAEKKPTLYGAKEKSVDDIVMRYGRNEFDTFASREEKKKNEKNIAI